MTFGRASVWTDERVELLRRCSDDGLSFGRTARVINEATGSTFTRNACIGKAKRIHLVHKHPTSSTPRRPRKPKASVPRLRLEDGSLQPDLNSLQEVEARPAPREFLSIALIDLEPRHCRYPRGGDGAPILFCGQPAITDSSYCAPCHARCCAGTGRVSAWWLKSWRRA